MRSIPAATRRAGAAIDAIGQAREPRQSPRAARAAEPLPMHRTLFNTPLVSPVLRALSRAFLRLTGWKAQGALGANARKSVLIAAPHTSNWDLPYTLMAGFAFDLNLYWMGKAALFQPPFGPLMRWLGGIAVDRNSGGNGVVASAGALREAEAPLQLVLAPEGTRGKTRQWRTGFYFIALQAQVPIVLAYMDYRRKVVGLGPEFRPSGHIERDMGEIKRFYAGVQGRNADQFDAG
jgi:1-acyl-sn-glycerol-3-phosphate acyltransferase